MDTRTELARKRRAFRDTLATRLVAIREGRLAPPPGFTKATFDAWHVAGIAKLDRLLQPPAMGQTSPLPGA